MSFFQKDEIKYLGLFYLSTFIWTLFAVTEPIIVVYFALKGFTFSQLSFALAAYFIAPFIFEVPTGVVADIFGRKISVILSLLLMGLGILYVPFASNFIVLVAIFFFIGFSKTLSTGADQAWVNDNLRHYKKQRLISHYYVKSQSFEMAAFVFSGLFSALLILTLGQDTVAVWEGIRIIGLDFLWFIEAAGIFAAAFVLMFAGEHFVSRKVQPKHFLAHSTNHFKSGFRHSFDNPVIFHLILAAFFMALAGGIFGIVYQPFLIDLGVPPYYLGYMISIIGLCGIFIPFIAKKLFKLVKKEKHYLSFVVAVQAVLIFLAFFVVSPLAGITLMVLLANIGNLEKPIQRPYFQKYLKSKIRATVASFESMFVHIGVAVSMVFGGILADLIGPKLALVSTVVFLIPAIISYMTMHEAS